MYRKKALIIYFFSLLLFQQGCKPSIPTVPTVHPKSLSPNQITTLKTFKKVADFPLPLYVMTYSGGYDPVLRDNIYHALKLQKTVRGCSVFTATNQLNEPVLARNHDYFYSPALVLFTKPPGGYASVSLVDLSFLGFDNPKKATSISDGDRTKLLYAPYLPCDGMNEYGLAIGMTYVPEAEFANKPGQETIFSLEAVRLLLDHAKNINEAIELLSKYNITFPVLPSHFLIADSSGETVVVEFIKGKIEVIRSQEPWMVATNFLIQGNADSIKKYTIQVQTKGDTSWDINGKSYFRFITANEALRKSNGRFTTDEVMDLLKKISLAKLSRDIWMTTQWSVVYGLSSGKVQVVMNRNYHDPKEFFLDINQ
ncbi:MAG: carcinine hydrolase/isopenicillin-N N-acyltransferase family protein [Bacteroidota bacterium]